MSMTIEQIRSDLDAKIPADAVRSRNAAGMNLSYLEGHYVIDRLNKVLGQGCWAYGHELTLVNTSELNGKYFAAYLAKVKLVVEFPGGVKTEFTDVGYGDGYDKSNPGKPHESASKEAVTDGLKRCAKSLGMSMGLALYDKDQTNVEDDAPAAMAAPKVRPATVAPKIVNTAEAPKVVQGESRPVDRNELNTLLSSAARVAAAKRNPTDTATGARELLADMRAKYDVKTKEELTNDQAVEFLNHLQSI